MQNLGGTATVLKIEFMFPHIKMVNAANANKWIQKINKVKSAEDLAEFLKPSKQPTYTGLTSEMVDHLLVYEHTIIQDAKIASDRLTALFYCPEDKDKFSLSIVQVSINISLTNSILF